MGGIWQRRKNAQTYPKAVANLVQWFPLMQNQPENSSFVPFNMDQIKPSPILDVLKSLNYNSSPGPNGHSYGFIYLLPFTHILATVFHKVLETGPVPSA